MKKIHIAALVVLATAAMSSCSQEKSFNDEKIGENGIVFSLQGAASTRSAEFATVQKGVKLELDADDSGQKLYLEETIEDLNASWAPATKGTPAYTQNVGKLYKDLGVVIKNGNNVLSSSNFWAMDNQSVGGGWRYQGEFSGWPDDSTPLDFYLWMPVSDNGITGTPTYTNTSGTRKISFNYTSPETASAQKDLIFAARSISKSDAKSGTNKSNGVPVLFNHALTGVKFAIENYDTSKKITIKSVSFTGLVGTASCEVTPASEDNYTDSSTHSSADENVVKWTIPTAPDRTATYSSGNYADTVYFAPGGSFENNGGYPSSFSQAGNKHNLNDTDATQTFWFIPQEMTDDVELTIVYTYGSDEERTGVLEFGKALSGVTWMAGQLRTYTIRVDEVNVKIEDTVTIATPTQVEVDGAEEGETLTSYINSTKTNVIITNTGNTDVYIRAALIGQWLDEESGDPVFGYTDYTSGQFKSVDSWYQDQFITKADATSPTREQGLFSGLIGYDLTTSNYWEKHDDGYYYYKYVVPADNGTIPGAYKTVANGKATDVAAPNPVGNQPLFISYTVKTAPAAAVSGAVKQIYFQLEIATQAISAKQSDGTYYTLEQAWAKANTADPIVD